MELLKVEKLINAKKILYDACIDSGFYVDKEVVDIKNAVSRIISNDIAAKFSVPSFRRSTVDGYAVLSSDIGGASENAPSFLIIVGESKMGETCNIKIKSGECVYVPTGGMLPDGADSVVMIEWTEKFADNKIAIYQSIGSGNNVVNIGDDNKAKDVLLKKGRKLRSSDIGLLSSNGIKEVEVYKKFDISIISTGDEIVDINNEKKDGEIYDINSYTLYSECIKNNFNVKNIYLVKDDIEKLRSTLKDVMLKSDVVVISGGSSKGKKDNTAQVMNEICSSKVLVHGIAVKPGKPTIISYDNNTKCVVIGLPGHPVAALLLFKELVVELYNKLVCSFNNSKVIKGKMCENIAQNQGRTTFQLVTIDDNLNVHLVLGKSGLINTMSKADGYIIIDEIQEGVNVGEIVDVYLLD